MLTATDFLQDNEREQIYSIARGEGSTPLSIFRDQYSEELISLSRNIYWSKKARK